ncbi:MAG: DNA polymerase III subunit beta, partial [Parcubacteria group bacterium]|nr:DNA polymerase III subunit beta [Parcubacteria group bacterium]
MKIICTKENLLKSVSIVSSCIKKSATLSILSNILLEVEKGQIKLSATNLEIGIITNVRG